MLVGKRIGEHLTEDEPEVNSDKEKEQEEEDRLNEEDDEDERLGGLEEEDDEEDIYSDDMRLDSNLSSFYTFPT